MITTNTNNISQSSSDDEYDEELHEDSLWGTQAFIKSARNEIYARLLPPLRRLFLREGISHFSAIQDKSLVASGNAEPLAWKSDILQIISATKNTMTEILQSSQPEAPISSELTHSLAILSRQSEPSTTFRLARWLTAIRVLDEVFRRAKHSGLLFGCASNMSKGRAQMDRFGAATDSQLLC